MRLFSAILFAAAALATPVLAGDLVPAEAYMHSQTLVPVEGARRLNLFCMGHGSPTVLFDSGLNGFSLDWFAVQAEVAKFTRACSYDRAGWGFSDPRTHAMDVTHIVEDVHHLIASDAIGGRVVYVGHSIAGLYGVGLAGTYPDDVAGEVLVEPSYADLTEVVYAPMRPQLRQDLATRYHRLTGRIGACAELAVKGELSPVANNGADDTAKWCMAHDVVSTPYDDVLRPVEAAHFAKVGFFDSLQSEIASNDNVPADSIDEQELKAIPNRFGDKPLIVLSADDVYKYIDSMTDDEARTTQQHLVSGHEAVARLSSRGVHRTIPKSDHYIHISQPPAVIAAVREVVEAVRADKKP